MVGVHCSGCGSVGRAPKVRGLNPTIGKILYITSSYCQLLKDKNKEKEAWDDNPLKRVTSRYLGIEQLKAYVGPNYKSKLSSCWM